jgi:uncharacterized protein YndB with AHSA1/START domain
MSTTDTTPAISPIVAEITINAPAERVFEALVNPAQRVAWWGMKGRFEAEDMESDLRPGGRWIMRGTTGLGGKPWNATGEYRTVERPRRLVFTWLPSWHENATESVVSFELDERNGVTTVRLTHSGLTSEEARAKHQGWPQILTWLRDYVQK